PEPLGAAVEPHVSSRARMAGGNGGDGFGAAGAADLGRYVAGAGLRGLDRGWAQIGSLLLQRLRLAGLSRSRRRRPSERDGSKARRRLVRTEGGGFLAESRPSREGRSSPIPMVDD